MKSFAVILCLAGAPLAAQTASGNEIAAACKYLDEADVRGGYCVGYILGAWEGMKLGAFQMLLASGAEGTTDELDRAVNVLLGVCLPDTVERGQITDVAIKFFEDNPAQRHVPARALIAIALKAAFPCN